MARSIAIAVLLVGGLVAGQSPALAGEQPYWRKLQVKMVMEFCSAKLLQSVEKLNTADSYKYGGSQLLPCQAAALQVSFKALPKEDRAKAIEMAIEEVEKKRKKKIALAIHEDMKTIYDDFCGTRPNSEICKNAELKNFMSSAFSPPPAGAKGHGIDAYESMLTA